ncbi:MAG: ABC transporter ATP-binding protein [Alphaproteobacteria bacterium]
MNKNTNITSLPKSLWRFYLNYGFKGLKSLVLLWMIAFFFVTIGDGVVFPNFQRWVVALFEQPIPAGVNLIQYALPTIIFITVINITLTISQLIQSTVSARTQPIITNKISETLTGYTYQQSMSFWANKMSGSINTQIGYIEKGAMAFYQLFEVACLILVILINGTLLFAINKYVAYLFIFAIFFRVLYAWLLRKKVKQASEDLSTASSKLSGKLVDSFSNYSIIKLFSGAEKEKQALMQPRQEKIRKSIHSRYTMRLFWGVPGILWDLMFGATILFCCLLYQHGQMTVAEIVYTISVYMGVMWRISYIVNRFPDIIDMTASAKKAYRELVVPLTIIDKENAKNLKVNRGGIEFNGVYFKYRNKYVLKDLSLIVNPGERVGIVGASGAGKTTLVNLLMRFYEPQSGNILIDGQNIADVKQDSLRENIAFIPQDPTMFNRTIGDNIAYGKFGANITEIRNAAKKASADKFIMDTEKGYDSVVGDRGIKLSGGQRQRIAIARAFLKNAPILVLDEATSALDSETERAIQKSFEKLSRGRTTIAIAHRLSTLRNMDRIIVLDKGVIVEQGSHQQLLRKKGKYYSLWKMQSGGFMQEK